MKKQKQIALGLKANWKQFSLLVIINGFVGAMIGLERSIFPDLALEEFGKESNTAILLFIVVFGISKALTNYLSGKLANRVGRKNLLVLGWVIALPIPLILAYSNSWSLIILANALLGVSQGFTWSSTVVMKIDLVGEKNRGLAMGLNEFAGYLAVGFMAFISAYLAESYGVRPVPFLVGLGIAVIGLVLSKFLVKDTGQQVKVESQHTDQTTRSNIFTETSFTDRNLSSITQAGLVNNLNDGMIWGLLPMLLAIEGFGLNEIGKIVAIYPTVWGLGQLVTGKMADLFLKKSLIFWGMLVQGLAILVLPHSLTWELLIGLSIILGLGTAIVYPTFLAAMADFTHPKDRAESIGVFRLWRDLGYAIGAILSGITADVFGISYAVMLVGLLTLLSSGIVLFRMPGKQQI
jgi:MFS family permease